MSTQEGTSAGLLQSGRFVDKTRSVLRITEEICASPDDSLGALDVAALNLMCAAGLPGAEQLDFDKLFDWLDEAARKVDFETRRHWYRFIASPATYHHSPGYFCCYFLLQVLQEEFGVKYNPARAMDSNFQDPKCLNPDFRDSRDLFIHGIIDGPGGTCASMPVIYVAVGRRLGYPLKLVESRAHVFFRWDDPQGQRLGLSERVNIEGAGSGISSYPDDFYRTWPEPWTAADEAGGMYLKSLSPREELAAFLSTRAECLYDNGRTDEAIQAYRWACGLSPQDPRYPWRLGQIIRWLQQNLYEISEVIAMNREARRLAMRTSISGLSGAPALPPSPPHGDYCQCFHCKQSRSREGEASLPGHLANCQCAHCQVQRQTFAPAVPHSPHCMYFSSRQPRALGRQPTAGHPEGCACVQCRRQAVLLPPQQAGFEAATPANAAYLPIPF